jgi:hypothetical protein
VLEGYKMGITFIHRVLNAMFNRKKEDNAIGEAKNQVSTSSKAEVGYKGAKTVNARSKTNLKGKHKAETEVETEGRLRSCAVEINGCIDLINNSSKGTPGKSKGGPGRAKVDDRKADQSANNREDSGGRNSDKDTERSRQGVSPAEMILLLAKAEGKLSEAIVEAKEKDDKKKKGRKKKSN